MTTETTRLSDNLLIILIIGIPFAFGAFLGVVLAPICYGFMAAFKDITKFMKEGGWR